MLGWNGLRTMAAAAMLVTTGWAGAASAATVDLYNITNNTTDVSSQLSVEVTDNGTSAQFYFAPTTGASTFTISEIYFDDETPIFVAPPVEAGASSGVNMKEGTANPSDLPGGNTVGFSATDGMVADAKAPAPSNGISPGEYYTVDLTYAPGMTFDDLLAALADGSFMIGLHVISVNGGTSDSYVNLPLSPVPLPAAGLMLLGALGGLTVVKRRRKA